MFYYLYEIKNLVNSKIYIGVHQTSSLDDKYFGSGKLLKSAIKKYGKDNFQKTILKFFNSSEEMYNTERLIVSENFLNQDNVYNLKHGGEGGWDYINSNGLGLRTGAVWTNESKMKVSNSKKGKSTITEEGRVALSKNNGMKQIASKQKIKLALTNKSKTTEHKKKISESLKEWNRKRKLNKLNN